MLNWGMLIKKNMYLILLCDYRMTFAPLLSPNFIPNFGKIVGAVFEIHVYFFISIPRLSIVSLLFFQKVKHILAYHFSKVKHNFSLN